ncbi:hypothetical protein [Cellulomonas sp. ATA003]|uniref:membrane protein YczE n=1 Tax=Cellulomonas sp. ATA003 TaxID=3073064 RepID=UPI002873D8E3|nr:hypothetical protein [Cellulomonas sp. ATA003]WNB84473.1 hypothetical protein REH70_11535 [Cellulomonas sp. ATA003]
MRGASPARSERVTRRLVQLAVGLVLYALSITLLVRSGLGNMPWDVLSQGASRQTGWSFGVLTILISVLVLACWIPLRQRPGLGTVANVLVIGALVDPFLAVLARLPDPLPLWGAVALAVGGIGLNGLATALYIGARMGPGPRDGLMTGLVRRTGRPVGLVRTSIEVAVVAVGWVLGGTLGLATLAYAVGIGPIVHVLLPRLTVPVRTVHVDPRDAAVAAVPGGDAPSDPASPAPRGV